MPNWTIYLLHFDRPYPGGQRPQHYLGVTRLTADERLKRHLDGRGASFLRAVAAAGIKVTHAGSITWDNGGRQLAYELERRLKKRKDSYKKICTLCGGKDFAGLVDDEGNIK